jgi:hypothetical protein
MTSPTTVDLALRIERTHGRVRGTIALDSGEVDGFSGWLELTAALAGMIDTAERVGERERGFRDRHRPSEGATEEMRGGIPCRPASH